MSMLATMVAALLAAVYVEVPKTNVRNVRFPAPTLMLTRAKSGSSAFVHGPIHVNMAFDSSPVRKPLLRIICLCEVNGELQWMDGLWDKPLTNAKLSRSDLTAAFKAAGRDTICSEAICVSSVMPEVGVEPYKAAIYGEASNGKGFFRLDRSAANAKLLLYRYEVWQNGVLAEAWESSRTGLGKYDIPPDWFVRGRYQRKFRYLKSN